MRKVLSLAAVRQRVPYSRTTIWRKSRDPEDPFPCVVQLGPNRVGIFEDELEAYLASLPRRGPDKTPAEAAA